VSHPAFPKAATLYGELNADIAGANLVIQPETADKAEESSCIPLFHHNVVDYHPVNVDYFIMIRRHITDHLLQALADTRCLGQRCSPNRQKHFGAIGGID
jgi:hypothetical protein